MGKPQKVNVEKLRELHAKGMRPIDIAKHFGVGKSTISGYFKRLNLAATKNVIVEQAPKVVAKNLDAVEQLQKINNYANELLDLLMRWNRGEPAALQALESQVKWIKVGQSEEFEIRDVKFRDPRELAVKVMAEIRGQLTLQLEILQTLHDIKVVAEYHEALIELLRQTSPKLRDQFLALVEERQALRRALRATPVKRVGDEN